MPSGGNCAGWPTAPACRYSPLGGRCAEATLLAWRFLRFHAVINTETAALTEFIRATAGLANPLPLPPRLARRRGARDKLPLDTDHREVSPGQGQWPQWQAIWRRRPHH